MACRLQAIQGSLQTAQPAPYPRTETSMQGFKPVFFMTASPVVLKQRKDLKPPASHSLGIPLGTGSPQRHAQIPARGTHSAQVCLPAHAHIRIYILACTTTDVRTCRQAPSCPYSHVADSRAHTPMHDKRASCLTTSPHTPRAAQVTGSPHAGTQSHGQDTTHTHAATHSCTGEGLQAPPRIHKCSHARTGHVPTALCTRAQTLREDHAPNTCLARLCTRAAAHALVHARSYKHASSGNPRTRSRSCAHTPLHFTVI